MSLIYSIYSPFGPQYYYQVQSLFIRNKKGIVIFDVPNLLVILFHSHIGNLQL